MFSIILLLLWAVQENTWARPLTELTHGEPEQVATSAFKTPAHQLSPKNIIERDGQHLVSIDEEVIAYDGTRVARLDKLEQKNWEAPETEGQVFYNHKEAKSVEVVNNDDQLASDSSAQLKDSILTQSIPKSELWTASKIPLSVGNFDRVVEPFELDSAPIKVAKWKSRKTGLSVVWAEVDGQSHIFNRRKSHKFTCFLSPSICFIIGLISQQIGPLVNGYFTGQSSATFIARQITH